ncbi:hypothetical protein ABE096_10225 [Robertmurraya massiliosenegalensis]
MQREPKVILEDIYSAALRIETYTEGLVQNKIPTLKKQIQELI